ncbi:MAG: PLP-dependent transferase [Bacteroidales bacterium]
MMPIASIAQMQSFNLRFSRQCSNAMAVAKLLESYKVVDRVLYPGLEHHKTHDIAVRLFGERGFGAMVTLGFGGDSESQMRTCRDNFIESVSGNIKLCLLEILHHSDAG